MPDNPALTTLRRRLLIALKLAGLAPAFLIGLPLQWLALTLGVRPAYRWMPVLFHRYLLFVLRVRVEKSGEADMRRPLLIVSNHLSWLDIVVISSLAPVSFIAKSEVGTWPGFGSCARLQRSIFVERARRGKTGAVNKAIADRLSAGDAMVLFAEGTTSDGNRVLPFRSALIGAAQALGEGGTSHLQPLNIAYPAIAGLPATRVDQPFIAWYGDMELVPHLSDLFALPPITVRASFGAARGVEAREDRKALTYALEREVRRMHAAALGRAVQ
jgi:1-acyl-sn-glycerol-3-phosphate acyltransferase